MAELVFSLQALADLRRIEQYIALDSPNRAASCVEELQRHCGLLVLYPRTAPARDGLGRGIRILHFRRRAVILYRLVGSQARIIRVRHGSQGG